MPRKKSLATIRAQRLKLEAVERQIIGEMTTEVGQGMLNLFLQDPTNALWRKNPQLLARLEELAAAKGKAVGSPRQASESPSNMARNNPENASINGALSSHEKPENRAARFVPDIPDAEL